MPARKKKRSWRFKVGLVILALSLLGAGCDKKADIGVDKETTRTVQHSDWNEFNKPNHKFSLKYPQGWEWKPEIDKPTRLTGFLEREDATQEKVKDQIQGGTFTASYNLNIRVEDNQENLSAKEVVLKGYLSSARPDIEKTLETVTIAGVEAVKVNSDAVQVNSSGPVVEYRLAPNNGKVYTFLYVGWAHPETHEKYLDEFHQILETLKFTD